MKLIPVTVFTVGALFSFQVQAANGVSVQLPIDQSDIDAALATARTPQEAARTFAKLVTPAIAQAVAEALQRTLERTQAATDAIANPTTQDMFSSSANSALRLGPTEPNSAARTPILKAQLRVGRTSCCRTACLWSSTGRAPGCRLQGTCWWLSYKQLIRSSPLQAR
jgi:hypothetical protein